MVTVGAHQGRGQTFTLGRGNKVRAVQNAASMPPTRPGFSTRMKQASLSIYQFCGSVAGPSRPKGIISGVAVPQGVPDQSPSH